MKRSKHFRKDVILARLIFAMLCIVIGVLVGTGVSALIKYAEEKQQNTQVPDTSAQINTQAQIETELDTQSTEDTQDTQNTETIPPQGESETTETRVSYVVPSVDVRLRQETNTSSLVLEEIPMGTKVLLVETLDGWYKVSYQDIEGYISAEYADIVTETEGESPSVEDGYVIMLDPGHQLNGDSATEPNGPDSTEMKARVTSGATGVATGVAEYELTLEIALMLRDELTSRGYTVLMTRETHDVNISNMERAIMANEADADITVRIHANAYEDASVHGAETLAPSTGNPYVGSIAENSQKLSQAVIQSYCDATEMNNRGVKIDDTMTGINWCDMPVTIIELGFMSNPTDDTNMQDDAYQQKMIKGIADGIDSYFGL